MGELVVPRVGDLGSGDAIVVSDASDAARAGSLIRCGEGHLLPVTDLSGTLAGDADLTCPAGNDWREFSRPVRERFRRRREALAPWLRNATRPDLRLLAFLYVHEKELTARYAPGTKAGFTYGDLVPVPDVNAAAKRLAAAGYLDARLFDCFYVCGRCDSARLNVREECPSCRSPEIEEVRLIHHFRCAWLAPEADFQTSDGRLRCPKCARELRHYGSDHEAAGTALKCAACGYSGSDPLVGFVCMDCSSHFDGTNVQSVRAYHYALSEAGIRFLLSVCLDPHSVGPVLATTLPLDLILMVNASLTRNETFSVAEIVYTNELKVVGSNGSKFFDASRKQLIGDLAARLGEGCSVVQGGRSDYVFLADTDAAGARQRLRQILGKCVSGLRADLGLGMRIFEKADFLP